jgi:epoxyqueuosine reductase
MIFKFASSSNVGDFDERHQLGQLPLFDAFLWSKATFEQFMQGSAIYRIGYEQWMRNVAVGLGNLIRHESTSAEIKQQARDALQQQYQKINDLVDEHIVWALSV